MLRRHRAHYDSGAVKCLREIVARCYAGGDLLAGEKFLVYALLRNGVANFFFVHPESNLMGVFASQNDRKGRTPSARTDDCDVTHARFGPRRISVPARSRRIFARCLTRMSKEASDIRARPVGER